MLDCLKTALMNVTRSTLVVGFTSNNRGTDGSEINNHTNVVQRNSNLHATEVK
jgi:hypothetical protein